MDCFSDNGVTADKAFKADEGLRLRKAGGGVGGNKIKAMERKEEEIDFLWMLTEEPHRSRRKAILKAHPEVSLMRGWDGSRLVFEM